MLKKLDQYIIKTFFGPFLFIFSVLFFIFIVNIVWTQLAQFTGKGLSYFQIAKLLFYIGVSVVKMVLPLTVLLASIMTFGDFGERYELAAMKSAGISLLRIMRPLLVVVSILAVILYFFSNNIIPDFQRKAKNMLYNIAATKPALNFTPGQFINQIPGYSVKFNKIYGEDGEFIEGIFVHKVATSFENNRTIIAKEGRFVPATDRNYLKLVLHSGYVFEDDIEGKDFLQREKQPNQSIKFDTLVQHFDVSAIINQAIEEERIRDDYQFQTYRRLNATIDTLRRDNQSSYSVITGELISQHNTILPYLDKTKKSARSKKVPFRLDSLNKYQRLELLAGAYSKINQVQESVKNKRQEVEGMTKYYSKVVMYQQQIIAYSFTCLLFFLIGSSLGSIIRKGGVGLPVVIAIVIFIIFYITLLTMENLAWKGKINPYLAAWLPNLLMFPFAVWMTVKALTDSQLFDAEKYKALFMPIVKRFSRKKEHARYQ